MTPVVLSAAQQQVVTYRGGDLQVIACAGSGKTESIARRIAALVEEGGDPASIVAFTFTDRAAGALKERIVRRVAERLGETFRDRLGPMYIGTIHAYCLRLLQDHVPRYGNFDVLDENRHAGLLSREHRGLGLSRLGSKHWQPIRDFAKTVDVIGNELIPVESLDGTPLGECVREYRDMLERYRFLTYATLVSSAVACLEQPAIRARVTAKVRHLVVDEYQDINPAQERLIQLLAQPPVTLCVVGDDDQAIYQWRGSEVQNILEFTERRPGSETVRLDENRRSRPAIVATAAAFAETIPARLPKHMTATRAPSSPEIITWAADTDVAEAEAIAATIGRLRDAGFHYRDVAVLFRSVRTSAPPLLDALEARGIPYACGGRTGLFLQPDILLFGEVYAWFVNGDWKESRYGEGRPASLAHLVHGLSQRFGGADERPALRRYLEDWKAFQLRGLRTVSLVEDFYRLLSVLGAHEIAADTPDGSARLGAFARFSEILADFEHVQRRGGIVERDGKVTFHAGRDRGQPYFYALYQYLVHWAQEAYEDFSGEAALQLDAVDVMTVHQAKGLEWPIVFMPALVTGRHPSARAGREQAWLLPPQVFPPTKRARYEGGDDEERRLFYVALTRAKDTVYLSHFERKSRKFAPSPYFNAVASGAVLDPEELPIPTPARGPDAGEPPAPEISFSDLARLDECGYAYRLAVSLGFQLPLAVELGYGKGIHHVLRQLAEVAKERGIPSAAELERLVDQEFYVPFASPSGFQSMRLAASKLVARYLAEYAADLARIWAVERPFALHFDEGVVSGRADVILDREAGQQDRLAIVDYKVSADAEREDRYRLQLAVYAAAGRGEGLDVHAAYLHELSDGVRHAVDIGADATTTAAKRVRGLLTKARDGQLDPQPDERRCGRCDYRHLCRHAAVKD